MASSGVRRLAMNKAAKKGKLTPKKAMGIMALFGKKKKKSKKK